MHSGCFPCGHHAKSSIVMTVGLLASTTKTLVHLHDHFSHLLEEGVGAYDQYASLP